MAREKKITAEEYIYDVICKEFDIVESGLEFKDFHELREYCNNTEEWYQKFSFKTPEKFIEWKNYCLEHFYDWQPKRISKHQAQQEFGWLNLSFGFSTDFTLDELDKYEKNLKKK